MLNVSTACNLADEPNSIFQGEVDDDHDVDGVDRTHQHRVVKVRCCQIRVDFRLKKKRKKLKVTNVQWMSRK